MFDFDKSWQECLNDGPQYWAKLMEFYTWFTPYEKILDDETPYKPKWFVGGKLNLCYDCLDRKVKEGLGDKIAYIFDSAVAKTVTYYTYSDLLNKVSKLSGALIKCGVTVGDSVLIYMPTMIETLISMLAVCRIGAKFSVLNGDYSDELIADRIDDLKATVAFVCNAECDGVNVQQTKAKLDRANTLANCKLVKCIVFQRPQFPSVPLIDGRDIDFEEAIRTSDPHECIPVEANSPLFIIFTSGTTGKPKGVVHSVRGVAVAVVQEAGELIGLDCNLCYVGGCYAWITGLLYNCFMPLLRGLKSIVYEGSSSVLDVREIYRIISEHKIETYFTPTCNLRMLRQQDPFGHLAQAYKPFHLKRLYSGAVPGDSSTLEWAEKIFNLPAPQIYGSTEVGGIVTMPKLSNGISLNDEPILSSCYPLPGLDVRILREDGSEADVEEVGEIVLKAPFSPILSMTVLGNHDIFVNAYFRPHPGYFDMKDYGKLDVKGRLYVFSRSDDVFKAGGGNKISCSAIEDVILSHGDVIDCVVTTKMGDDHGSEIHIPIPFVILKNETTSSANDIAKEVVEMVHRQLGNFIPIMKPFIFDVLPRTVTGKLQRGILKKLANSSEYELLKIEQPELQKIKSALLEKFFIGGNYKK